MAGGFKSLTCQLDATNMNGMNRCFKNHIDLSGAISLIDKKREDGQLTLNILLNYLPLDTLLKIKLMEYGDFSSLVVEYPNYNSLGKVLQTLYEFQTPKNYTNEAKKLQANFKLDLGLNLADLIGRAIIVTKADGDLVSYGILSNKTRESFTHTSQSQIIPNSNDNVKGVAMCENKLQYRALFQLSQSKSSGDVTFDGMLRTQAKMSEMDELVVSMNGKN